MKNKYELPEWGGLWLEKLEDAFLLLVHYECWQMTNSDEFIWKITAWKFSAFNVFFILDNSIFKNLTYLSLRACCRRSNQWGGVIWEFDWLTPLLCRNAKSKLIHLFFALNLNTYRMRAVVATSFEQLFLIKELRSRLIHKRTYLQMNIAHAHT